MRPSGVKASAVGSSRPMTTRSLTKLGVELMTFTVTGADVVALPAASRATAVSVWLPAALCVVSHWTWYGALVSSAPRSAPSTRKRTPATPRSSAAVAATVTVPLTVPGAGAVSWTVGGEVSQGAAVTVRVAWAERFVAAS